MTTPVPFDAEFVVNPLPSATQVGSRITELADGRFAVTLTRYDEDTVTAHSEVVTQIYNADGSASGSGFVISRADAVSDFGGALVQLANGNLVAVWADAPGASSTFGSLQARIFRPDGRPAGQVFTVTPAGETLLTQSGSVQALSDGRFVAVWSEHQGPVAETAKLQLFAADGSKIGIPVELGTSVDTFIGADVIALTDDRMLVTWRAGGVTLGRIVNPDGTPAGAAFVAVDHDSNVGTSFEALPNGGFLAISTLFTLNPFDTGDIRAQIFDASGAAQGAAIPVNTTTAGTQFGGQAAVLSDGRFVVIWYDDSRSPDDTSGSAVRGQLFNANGTTSGSEFRVNTITAGSQSPSDVTALADGRFVVTWATLVGHGDGTKSVETHAQIFDPRETALNLTGTGGADQLVGTAFADTLGGGNGSDRLAGAAGADLLNGGNGADVVLGGIGNDTLLGGAGDDRLNGGFGQDMLTGGARGDVFVFSSAAEAGKGTTADTITDFVSGTDKIDLSAFMTGAVFIGGAAFHGTGAAELRYDAATHVLSGDTDGNGAWNFSVVLLGSGPVATDFLF